MTHPTREEWMSYLYDELPRDPRANLQTHLDGCGECREQLATWQCATQQMGEWKLPHARRTASARTLTRWAIAAAVMALAAVGGLRLMSLENEVKRLRADVPRQVERELTAAFAQVTEQASKSASTEANALIAAVVQKLEEKRLNDQQTLLAALQRLNAQHVTDYAKFRKELETVALYSEAGLQRAENQISSLAYTPASFSNDK